MVTTKRSVPQECLGSVMLFLSVWLFYAICVISLTPWVNDPELARFLAVMLLIIGGGVTGLFAFVSAYAILARLEKELDS